MSKAVVLDDNEFARLKEMLNHKIVVVVKKSIADGFGEETIKTAAEDYSCGGEADVWVDFVGSDEHYFMDFLKGLKSNIQT